MWPIYNTVAIFLAGSSSTFASCSPGPPSKGCMGTLFVLRFSERLMEN